MSPPKSVKRKRNSPPRSPSVKRSPSTWSPKTKQAARTIKRIVTKSHAKAKYKNYTNMMFYSIRQGKAPTHFSALQRRMRTYPVTVNVPLYRGVAVKYYLPKNFPTKEKILKNGYFINKSFASYSKNRNTALGFGNTNNEPFYILRLPPGRYPAINREKFVGERNEMEVTLAPGIYTVNKNKPLSNNGNIRVTYKPLR
jgi:hypothetical protein